MATPKTTPTRFSFHTRSAKYHPANAYWLSVCSQLAYSSPQQARSTALNDWHLDRFNFISRKNAQCFITSNKKMIIIAFRGTEKDEIEDILTDLDVEQSNAYGGKVHHGFAQSYRYLKSPLLAKIKEHRTDHQPIWITGHSLGGALAVIAAMDLVERQFNVKGVYTFGQPRVGDTDFTNLYDQHFKGKSFRFINKDDKVPEMPPAKIRFGNKTVLNYGHGDQVIYITSRNRMTLNYKKSNDLLDQIESLMKAASAHSSEKYVQALLKNFDYNPITAPLKTVKEGDAINKQKIRAEIKKATNNARKAMSNEANKAKKSTRKVKNKLSRVL